MITFATCDVTSALRFINSQYPKHVDLTKEDLPILVDLLSRDVVRVQDPGMHQPAQIIQGTNYKHEEDKAISDGVSELLAALTLKEGL